MARIAVPTFPPSQSINSKPKMKVVSVKLVQDVSGLLNFWYWIHSHRLIIFIYNFPRKKRKMFPTISKYKLYLESVYHMTRE